MVLGLESAMREPMEMSSVECAQFLAGHRVGRVAFTTPMGPRAVPVGYTFDGSAILFDTAPYSVLGTYGRGHDVAFEVDEFDAVAGWGCSVVACGFAEGVGDAGTVGEEPLSWMSGPRDVRVRLDPRELSGRCVRASGEAPSPFHPCAASHERGPRGGGAGSAA